MCHLPLAQAVTDAGAQAGAFGSGGAVLLIAAGLALLGLEVFLPGMICGILGSVSLIAGIGFAFYNEGMMGGMVALLIVGAALLVGFWFYVKILPNTRLGGKLFLGSAIEGAGAEAPGDAGLVGQSGTAQTVLAPSGMVRVGDAQYEAVSRDGFIERGEGVVVLGRETLRLIVGKKGVRP